MIEVVKILHKQSQFYPPGVIFPELCIVHLSLLTMTNPNQTREVLFFMCFNMADETNLSSKLPVADRTREI